MLQNQNDQKLMHNQIFQEAKGRLYIKCTHRKATHPGYHHPSNEQVNDIDLAKVLGYQVPAEQHDYAILTREQRSRAADQHEHPYECENSPWRRQQTAGTGQGNGTYTNRY